MKNSSGNRRKINNELRTRGANKRVKKMLQEHTPKEVQDDLHINFLCECSRADCQERVALTLEEFEKLHAGNADFVIAKGHETVTIEKVKKAKDDLVVVKKYAL